MIFDLLFCDVFVLISFVHVTEASSSTQRVRVAGNASHRREHLQRMDEDGVVPRRRGAKGRGADVEPQPERWHEETSSFCLPFGEMTVTLDDVSCLLHLPIDGMLLSHETITRGDAVDSMVTHLGSDLGDALLEVTRTRGAHC